MSEGETFLVFQFSCLCQPNEDAILTHTYTYTLCGSNLSSAPNPSQQFMLVANLPSGLYYMPKHKIWNTVLGLYDCCNYWYWKSVLLP